MVTYLVFAPDDYKKDSAPRPLLVVFSPNGDGMAILDKLRSGANSAGWLLVPNERALNEQIALDVLYVGTDDASAKDFTSFLSEHFRSVVATDPAKLTLEMANRADVFLLDSVVRSQPDGYTKAMLMTGSSAALTGERYGSKIDWLCQCLDNEAYAVDTSHPIFHGPFPVVPTLVEKRCPHTEIKIQAWEVEEPQEDPGLVSSRKHFASAKDSEIISGGVNMKGISGVPLVREANRFLWGFVASPGEMTDEGPGVDLPQPEMKNKNPNQGAAPKTSVNGQGSSGQQQGWKLHFKDNFEGRAEPGDNYRTGHGMEAGWAVRDGVLVGKQVRDDHGSTIRTEVEFDDINITFDFRFSGGKSFNFVIDDKNEKSVHAGHICRVSIFPSRLIVGDDKTGSMNLDVREQRKNPDLSAEQKTALETLLASTQSAVKIDIKPNQWHQLRVRIKGDIMKAFLDGELATHLKSPGFAHPTKTQFGFTVNGSTIEYDNLKVLQPSGTTTQ